jgi:DNA-binding transcriptional LysR family regulator
LALQAGSVTAPLSAATPQGIGPIVNLLDTQIALVEAEEGIAIIPSFGMPACRSRKVVVSQLINPVARFDFHMISAVAESCPRERMSSLPSSRAILLRGQVAQACSDLQKAGLAGGIFSNARSLSGHRSAVQENGGVPADPAIPRPRIITLRT